MLKRQLLLLITIVLMFGTASSQAGETSITLCNGSPKDVFVANTYSYLYKGEEYWKEQGYWKIQQGRCERLPGNVHIGQQIGYAFVAEEEGEYVNLVFPPPGDLAWVSNPLPSQQMCARIFENFTYAEKRAKEVGKQCQHGENRLKYSFWYQESSRFSSSNVDVRIHISEQFEILRLQAENLTTDIENISTDPSITKTEARALYEKACNGGHINACVYAGNYFLYGEGGQRDVAGARQLYELGCEAGGNNACVHAARLAQFGGGGASPDPERANELYQLACDRGLSVGCEFLQ